MNYKKLMKFLGIGIASIVTLFFLFILIFFPTFKVEILSFVETYGYLAIFISSFLMDLIVQPFAPDVPLIGGILSGLNVYFVLLCVLLASYIASLLGYFIGLVYGEAGIEKVYGKKKYEKWKIKHNKYGKIILLAAALTPVPYVPFCWISGIFRMRKLDFVVYALLARTVRFIAGAYLTVLFMGIA